MDTYGNSAMMLSFPASIVGGVVHQNRKKALDQLELLASYHEEDIPSAILSLPPLAFALYSL